MIGCESCLPVIDLPKMSLGLVWRRMSMYPRMRHRNPPAVMPFSKLTSECSTDGDSRDDRVVFGGHCQTLTSPLDPMPEIIAVGFKEYV